MKTLEKALIILCATAFAATSSLKGQDPPSTQDQPKLYSFACRNCSIDALLDRLQELTGKTVTIDLGVQATFTLRTGKATASELIDLITQALNAQGIRLENLDENTIRVRSISKPHDVGSTPQRITPKEYTQQELEVHLQNYQMQMIRDGKTPLDVQLTPENIAILKSEGVVVPASVGGDKAPEVSNTMDLPEDFRELSDPSLPDIAHVAAKILTNSFPNVFSSNLIVSDTETTPFSSPSEFSSPSDPLDFEGCMSATFWLRDTIQTNYTGDIVEFRARGFWVVASLDGKVPEQAIWECDELYKRYDFQGEWQKSMYSCLPVNGIVNRNGINTQQPPSASPPQGIPRAGE